MATADQKTPNARLSKKPWPIRPILITFFALTLSGGLTFLIARGIDPSPWVATPLLLLTLININIILVVALVLLLSRNFIKFFFEKKGRGFKNKLVAAFVGLSLIPGLLLFFVASGLLTNSIETGLSGEVERSLDASLKVAKDYYAQARETTQAYAQQVGQDLRDRQFFHDCPACLNDFLRERQGDDRVLYLFSASSAPTATPPALNTDFFDPADPILPGQIRTTVATDTHGEILRVALGLERDEGKRDPLILVVDRRIPRFVVENIERVKRESATYKQLKRFKRPIQGGYILSFLIVALLIIFSAAWFGFYLARRITVPIERLAEGTAAVARGNLDFQIDLSAQDELGVLVTSFNKMTRDLKQNREDLLRAQTLATWQEVALQMAHEIKNPLTPIQLSTERLRKKYAERSPEFDSVFDTSTQTIINEVGRLVTLVNEFSNFARLPPLNLTLQSILPIAQEVVQLYQSGHKNIAFYLQADTTLPPLRLDQDALKQLLINLFENAVDALVARADKEQAQKSDARGEEPIGIIEISVVCDRERQEVILTVADDGVGIAPEDIAHIFLPHFSRKKRGTGLGLALAHRIMVDHGGEILASPRKPHGTMLTLTFPASVNAT